MDVSRDYTCAVFTVNLGALEQAVKACCSVTHSGSKVGLLGENM